MKKVCIVSPVHPYNDVRIFQKEAITLKRSGYVVELFAKAPNDLIENEIKVIRTPNYNTRFSRFTSQPSLLYRVYSRKADIYHLHNPDMLLIGFFLKFMGKKVVYDTHEDFSKRILMREWIPSGLRKTIANLVTKLETKASQYFDAIIVTQPQLKSRYGDKAYLIENAPILINETTNRAYEIVRSISKEKDVIRLIYVGGISRERGITQIVEALSILNINSAYRLWLIGPCYSEEFIQSLKRMDGWKYVDYYGFLAQEKAFAYIMKADIGLVTILDVADHSTTSPNKLFEYQRFSVPYVASNFPKWIDQVGHTNSGTFADPLNVSEIVQSILSLGNDQDLRTVMGENGKRYIFEEFNWDIESGKLLEVYNSILKRKRKIK